MLGSPAFGNPLGIEICCLEARNSSGLSVANIRLSYGPMVDFSRTKTCLLTWKELLEDSEPLGKADM